MTLLYSLTLSDSDNWLQMGLLAYLHNTNRNLKVKTSKQTTKLFKIVKLMQVKLNQV